MWKHRYVFFIYRELLYNCPVTCYTLEQIKQPKIRRRDKMNLFELYNVLKDGQKGRNNFLVTVVQEMGLEADISWRTEK